MNTVVVVIPVLSRIISVPLALQISIGITCDFFSRVGVYVYRIAVVVVRIPVPTASIVPVHIGTVVSRMWPNPDLRSRHR